MFMIKSNNKINKKIELFNKQCKSRGYYNLNNRLNDLTGKEWVFSTKSVIPKSFPSTFQHKLRNEHGGQKPPELCELLIRTFTKDGEQVLDPFCGVGGTLFGCHLSKRHGVGIEINKKWIDIYNNVCKIESIKPERVIHGDSRKVVSSLFEKIDKKFDFILTDIPYWKMDVVEKSKGSYKKVGEESKKIYVGKSKLSKFNESHENQFTNKDDWEDLIKNVFTDCFKLLKEGGYCAVFIGNMYHDGKYYLLNADIANILTKIGYVLKGEIIWYDVSKSLHLYAINFSWIPSLVHQFIMIFRKERIKKFTKEELKRNQEDNLQRISFHQNKKKNGLRDFLNSNYLLKRKVI